MLCCPNCGSRFFKILSLRYQLNKNQIEAVLYKKRCKRCKQIHLFQLALEAGGAKCSVTEHLQWQNAILAHKTMSHGQSTVKCPLVSDYTRLISSDTSRIFNRMLRRKPRT
jgi:hypothetical protein